MTIYDRGLQSEKTRLGREQLAQDGKENGMKFYFSGCRNVTILSAIPVSEEYGSLKHIIIAGVDPQHGGGTYSGEHAGLSVHVHPPNDTIRWSLTIENQNRFNNDAWEESPVMFTDTGSGTQIAANDDSQGTTGPYDDLVLLVIPCVPRVTVPLLETWVSYGVMVDAGGPTGVGPVPPNNPNFRQFAAGLVLAQAAELVSPELRSGVLAIAAQQIRLSAGRLAETIEKA